MVAVKNIRSRTYPLLSQFQNDCATVECSRPNTSTSPDPVSNFMLLEERDGRKMHGEGIEVGSR